MSRHVLDRNSRHVTRRETAQDIEIVVHRGGQWAPGPPGTALWGIRLGQEEWTAASAQALGKDTPPTASLRAEAEKVLYRALQEAWPPAEITAVAIARGDEIGVHLPIPEPTLVPWRPGTGNKMNGRETNEADARAFTTNRAMIVPCELPQDQAVLLEHAAEKRGFSRLLQRVDDRYSGIEWYDELKRVTAVEARATKGADARWLQQPGDQKTRRAAVELVDAISVRVHTRRANGKREHIDWDSEIGFERDALQSTGHEDARLVIVENPKLSIDALARIGRRALARDGVPMESGEERSLRFVQYEQYLGFQMRAKLKSPAAAATEAITQMIEEQATRWLERVPERDRTPITIGIEVDGTTTVTK